MQPNLPFYVNIQHHLAPEGGYSIVTLHDRLGRQVAIFHDAQEADYVVNLTRKVQELEAKIDQLEDKNEQ